jgi:IS30 family transposase
MATFSDRMVPEVVQAFWAALQRGEFITDAAAEAGTYRKKGARWLVAEGGGRPRRGRNLQGRCLSFAEREEIALGRAGGESMRSIAARLGRSPSTISRELSRNGSSAGEYRASSAHALAYHRASRPKPAKLATNLVLRRKVEHDLEKRYSPEQIAGRLRREFPDDPEMWVSTETIYQSIYVQSRGALRRDLAKCLRTGRALRRPSRAPGQRKNRIPDMINISERPAEVEDRAIPGAWEGDLIIGKRNLTAIGTLVERATGYTMLLHLPEGYQARAGARRPGREDQWPAAAILPEGQRPVRAQRRRPGLGRPRTQRPTSQEARFQEADRRDRGAPVALTARIRRSATGTPQRAGARAGAPSRRGGRLCGWTAGRGV